MFQSKIASRAFLYLFLFLFLISCKDDDLGDADEEVFYVEIDASFSSSAPYYVLFSNQYGEEVFDYKLRPSTVTGGIWPISFIKKEEDLITASFIQENEFNDIKRFNIHSYFNIANRTQFNLNIVDSDFIIFYNWQIKTIFVGGVQSIEDIQMFAQSGESNFSYEIIDGNAYINIPHHTNSAVYFIIKANGEDEYRYYYNLPEENEIIAFQQLPKNLIEHTITFYKEANWQGRIAAYDSEKEIAFYIYERSTSSISEEINSITFYFPDNINLEEFQIDMRELGTSNTTINHISSELPTELFFDEPTINISENTHTQNIGYDINGNYDLEEIHINYARFDSINQQFYSHNWRIFKQPNMDGGFALPTMSDNILDNLSSLSNLAEPTSVVVRAYQFNCEESSEDFWDNPFQLNNLHWSSENCAYRIHTWHSF